MRSKRCRAAGIFARMIVASGVALGLPTLTVVAAQAARDEPTRPAEPAKPAATTTVEAKTEIRIDFAPAKIAAPAPIAAKAVILRQAVMAPAAPGAAAPAGAALEQMNQQMARQLRPILRVELRFLTTAAEPTPGQRREIAIEGARSLLDAAKKVAAVQHALQNGGWNGGEIPDARKLIREGMLQAAKARLSPEQFARYHGEVDSRAGDQRNAILLNLVANMDRLLFLSDDQRSRIREALLSHWDDRTFPTLENLANYEAYFPVLPEAHFVAYLNDAQRKTWNGAQKVTFGQSFNFQFNNGMPLDPADEDEDEKAAMAEVEKQK